MFRAAGAAVIASDARLGAKPPCLSTFCAHAANSFRFCELHVKDTYRKVSRWGRPGFQLVADSVAFRAVSAGLHACPATNA